MDFEKDFRDWYLNKYNRPEAADDDLSYIIWEELPFSMKWGVIVDFFDEKEIRIQIEPDQPERYESGDHFSFFILTKDNVIGDDMEYKTRNEARKAAYEKAKEIYEQLNQEQ